MIEQHVRPTRLEPEAPLARTLDPRRFQALVVVPLAAFLAVLDFFIVNISIPSIQKGLHASFSELELVIAGYGLVYALGLVTGGRLGDIYGRKRAFLVGVAGFTLASALCGLAWSPAALIGARALQGLAAAIMFPQVLSIIRVEFAFEERTRAFALFGTTLGLASVSGPILGGILIRLDLGGLGWRPIFLVNLPFGLVALALARRLVRESRAPEAPSLDLRGVALLSVGLSLLLVPLVLGREAGWPLGSLVALALSVPALGAFLLDQRRKTRANASPLVDLRLLAFRPFLVGLAVTAVFCSGLSAFFFMLTLFLQEGLGLDCLGAAALFAPFALGFVAASNVSPRLEPRLGRSILRLGAGLMFAGVCGLIALVTLSSSVSAVALAPVLLVYGTGQGFILPSLVNFVMSGAPAEHAGAASGIFATTQQVAYALGVATIGGYFSTLLGSQPSAASYFRSLPVALGANLLVLAATIVLVGFLPRKRAASLPLGEPGGA